jgi:hypothetical protein
MTQTQNDFEKAIVRGIWRQKNQETWIAMFVYLIVLPALFVLAILSFAK